MKYVITTILLCIGFYSYSQQDFKSLDEIMAFADAHNADLVNARFNVSLAEKELAVAKSALFPQVSASAGFQDNLRLSTTLIPAEIFGGPEGTYREAQFGQKYSYNTYLTGSIDIINLGTWFEVKSKKLAASLAGATQASIKQAIHEQIALAYYMALLSDEAYRLSVLNKQISDSLLQSATDKFNEGLLDEITLNNIKINNRLLSDNLCTNATARDKNIISLKLLMGIAITDSVTLSEMFSMSFDDTYAPQLLDFGTDPSVLVSSYRFKQAKVEGNIARTMFCPRLTFVSSFGYQQFNQEFAPSFTSPSWKPVQNIGLRLEVPVFTGMSRLTNVKMAKLNKSIAENNYQAALSKADAENWNLFGEFYLNKEKVKNAIEIQNLYISSYQLTQQRYAEGVSNIEQYLQAFTDFLAGQSRYLTALSDYYISKAKIRERTNNK